MADRYDWYKWEFGRWCLTLAEYSDGSPVNSLWWGPLRYFNFRKLGGLRWAVDFRRWAILLERY
jgi:hypothetical protein